MESIAVIAPPSRLGIMAEVGKDQRAAGRSLGSILTSPSPPPAFSSCDADDEGGSSSSYCSSSSTFLSDDEEERDDEVDSLSTAGHAINSPLGKMSDLMAHLPIKRGLSRHYNGKSQSYTSLASVTCLDDLRKPERGPARKKLKSCRSYGGGMAGAAAGAAARHSAINIFLPPPAPLLPAFSSPVKPAATAAVNKMGSTPSSLQRPPPTLMSRRPPPVQPPHRPAGFPATHHQPLLFA